MNKETNKLLKGLFSLDHNIKLYIPTTTNVDQETDTSDYVHQALQLFGDKFGGATSYDAIGAWTSQERGLVTERVVIVESYATREAVEQNLSLVIEFATKLKTELSQEAISLEYDNKLYFI